MKLSEKELRRAHELQQFVARSCGCCWHSVLEDGNVDDKTVEHHYMLVNYEHAECKELIPLIERMSRTQRLKLGRGGYQRMYGATMPRPEKIYQHPPAGSVYHLGDILKAGFRHLESVFHEQLRHAALQQARQAEREPVTFEDGFVMYIERVEEDKLTRYRYRAIAGRDNMKTARSYGCDVKVLDADLQADFLPRKEFLQRRVDEPAMHLLKGYVRKHQR